MENNDIISNKIIKENQSQIYLNMMSCFLFKIQNKLDIGFGLNEKYSFPSIEKLGFDGLKRRLDLIEDRIDLLVDLQTKKSTKDLLTKITEDNDALEKEIDELKESQKKNK